MSIEFKMPDLGENIEKAEVGQLLVSVGDVVEPEQTVLELETDKAVFDLPCPHAGTVTKIHVKQGDVVSVGDLVLTLEESEGGASKKTEEKEPAKEQAPKKEEKPEKAAEAKAEPKPAPAEEKPAAPASPPPKAAAKGEDADRHPPAPAGPATRRFARELGVDLQQVSGSGPGGRITIEDVQAYVQKRLSSPAGGAVEAAAPPLPDFTQWGPVERKPMNKIAKTAAQHLAMSWRVAPHVTQHDLADVTELEAARQRYGSKRSENRPKITMTALVMKAVVIALKEFPHFNASYDERTQEVVEKHFYHLGCAVDTEHGLLVPVVRDCDKKSVAQIAAEISELADRARKRKLDLSDMQGGTFTITNLGGIGGTAFTPIINHPELAILGLSRSRWEPVFEADGSISKRLMLPLSLSYDHRVINGADGARFVRRLADLLSDAFLLLAEI